MGRRLVGRLQRGLGGAHRSRRLRQPGPRRPRVRPGRLFAVGGRRGERRDRPRRLHRGAVLTGVRRGLRCVDGGRPGGERTVPAPGVRAARHGEGVSREGTCGCQAGRSTGLQREGRQLLAHDRDVRPRAVPRGDRAARHLAAGHPHRSRPRRHPRARRPDRAADVPRSASDAQAGQRPVEHPDRAVSGAPTGR